MINEHCYEHTTYICRYTQNAFVTAGREEVHRLAFVGRNANSLIADCRITRARIYAEFGMYVLNCGVPGANLTLSTSRVSYPPSYLDITAGGSTDPLRFLQSGIQFTRRFVLPLGLYIYMTRCRTWQFH